MASAPQANPLPLFYKDLMPLNSRDHATWSSRITENASWMVGQHAIPLTAETPVQLPESPGSYRGGAVAAQVCAQCHDIGNGSAPAINVGAPAFREIAGRPATTAEGLAAWMRTSHPAMPNFIFSGQEVTDLAEYITNLAKPAQ